jgi:hypothetical protein
MTDFIKLTTLSLLTILFSSCRYSTEPPVGTDGWLDGDTRQKFETVARQLGGFSQTMREVDYRFQELYWAGNDMNWEYALHQIEELQETYNNGLERRPVRTVWAHQFAFAALPELEKAVIEGDAGLFEVRFLALMNNCNSCHVAELKPFLTIRLPEVSRSSIRLR